MFDPGTEIIPGDLLKLGFASCLEKGYELINGGEGVSEGGGPTQTSVLIPEVVLNKVLTGYILFGELREGIGEPSAPALMPAPVSERWPM